MKKIALLFFMVVLSVASFGQIETPIMKVDKKNYDTLADLGDPKLTSEDCMSIILLGDTQTYSRRRTNAAILKMMTSWIAAQQHMLNVKAVLAVGDIVEMSNKIKFRSAEIPDLKRGYVDSKGLYRQGLECVDYSSTEMWKTVSDAFSVLDNRIPYFITTGNHDHGHVWGEARYSRFNEFFNADRNHKNFEALREVGFDENGKDALQNAVYKLSLGGKWGDLYVLTLEFKPRAKIIKWAEKILAKPEYKGKRFIMITHAFLHYNGKLSDERRYPVKGLSGDEVWEQFVSKHSEIKAIFCGHHCKNSNDFDVSTCFKYMKNDAGKDVAIMMFDPQTLGGGFGGNGGDGWLRILELKPDGETVGVKTYSPLFGISPMTKHYAWRTAEYDMFDFKLSK